MRQMKTITAFIIIVLVFLNTSISSYSHKINNSKGFNKIEKKEISTGSVTEEIIPVNVKNDFDEEIRVKLDTNREYPVGAHEWITLGKRKSGRYTLTIYNKKGEFVDNLTKNIDNKNKFVLNENTVSNSGRITGLSTGQKVAITAGAIGAAALGTALINKALHGEGEQEDVQEYVPPAYIPPQQANVPVGTGIIQQKADVNNAFAPGGKPFKFLNAAHEKITLVIEGTDGSPIGNNWIIPKAGFFQKPQPLIFNDEKITINPDQKIKAVLPNGTEILRNAFELESDPFDGSYVWVLK